MACIWPMSSSDSVGTALTAALRSPYVNALVRVSQLQTEPLDLPYIEATVRPSLETDRFVSRYYVWSEVSASHRGEVLAFERDRTGFTVDPPESARLLELMRRLAQEKKTIGFVRTDIDGNSVYFQAMLRYTAPARDRSARTREA